MLTETFSKWIVVNLELCNLKIKGTRFSIMMTVWVLCCFKTFTSVFITTACLRILSTSLPQYLSSPSSSHYWLGTDRQREVTLPGSAEIWVGFIWLEKYTGSVSIFGLLPILVTAFRVLLITDSALNTIKVHDSSHPRTEVFHRNHNVPISFHCPSQAPRVTSLEGDTFF